MDATFSLADRVIQWTFDPCREVNRRFPAKIRNDIVDKARMFRQEFKQARRFVLDDDFVREWIRLSSEVNYDKMRNRCDLANLPFDRVWLEFDNEVRLRASSEFRGTPLTFDPDKDAKRNGFYFYRDDIGRWAFKQFSQVIIEGDWSDAAIPNTHEILFDCPGFSESETGPNYDEAMDLWGFIRDDERWLPDPLREVVVGVDYDPLSLGPVVDHYMKLPATDPLKDQLQDIQNEAYNQFTSERIGVLRSLVTLLAMINYVPIRYVNGGQRGAYKRRLRNLHYMDYQLVQIEVSKTRTLRRTVDKAMAYHEERARRRAHEVRGHWRHWLRSPRCTAYDRHHWDSMPSGRDRCLRCNSLRTWVEPHVRGDASIGFINHDYQVTKG